MFLVSKTSTQETMDIFIHLFSQINLDTLFTKICGLTTWIFGLMFIYPAGQWWIIDHHMKTIYAMLPSYLVNNTDTELF